MLRLQRRRQQPLRDARRAGVADRDRRRGRRGGGPGRERPRARDRQLGQVLSFGIARSSTARCVASPSMPDGTVLANVPFGVADASLGGSVYTPASAGPLVVQLPIGHEVTFEKVNTGGLTAGQLLQRVGRALRFRGAATALAPGRGRSRSRASPAACPRTCGATRSHPLVRCDPANGEAGCYYLVFVADTGANVFGGTQQHHFEEDEFGFSDDLLPAVAVLPSPTRSSRASSTAPTTNDPVVVEGDDVFDITSGCGSHIGRGGAVLDVRHGLGRAHAPSTIATGKLDNLRAALDRDERLRGRPRALHHATRNARRARSPTTSNQAQQAWDCHDKALTVSYLDQLRREDPVEPARLHRVPGAGLPVPQRRPGELVVARRVGGLHGVRRQAGLPAPAGRRSERRTRGGETRGARVR